MVWTRRQYCWLLSWLCIWHSGIVQWVAFPLLVGGDKGLVDLGCNADNHCHNNSMYLDDCHIRFILYSSLNKSIWIVNHCDILSFFCMAKCWTVVKQMSQLMVIKKESYSQRRYQLRGIQLCGDPGLLLCHLFSHVVYSIPSIMGMRGFLIFCCISRISIFKLDISLVFDGRCYG